MSFAEYHVCHTRARLFTITVTAIIVIIIIISITLSHSRIINTITTITINPYPTAFPYGNGMVLHFYQQQESSTTKTVHKVINKGLKTYV